MRSPFSNGREGSQEVGPTNPDSQLIRTLVILDPPPAPKIPRSHPSQDPLPRVGLHLLAQRCLPLLIAKLPNCKTTWHNVPSLLSDMNVDRERRQGGFIPFSENANPTNQNRERSKRYDQHVLRLEKAAGRKPLWSQHNCQSFRSC